MLGSRFDLTDKYDGHLLLMLTGICAAECFRRERHQRRIAGQLLHNHLTHLVHRDDERAFLAVDIVRQVERQFVVPVAVGEQVNTFVLQRDADLRHRSIGEDVVVRNMRVAHRHRHGYFATRTECVGEPHDGCQQHKQQIH